MPEDLTNEQQSVEDSKIEDVTLSAWEYIEKNYVTYIILYSLLFLFVIFFFLNLFSIGALFFIGFVGYKFIFREIKSQLTKQFGKSIGFSYASRTYTGDVYGKLFNTGRDQSIVDVLSGACDGMPMRIFSFSFTVGSGKNAHTYSYTVFEAKLLGTVPNILLYSKGHESAVSDWLSGNETINLEGNFNEYFKLRVPEGHGREAYEIFTPEIMAHLIDEGHEFSIEFIDNIIYIYATKIITKRAELERMFNLSRYLAGLFKKNTARINVT